MARYAVSKAIEATDDIKRTAREETISVHNMEGSHRPEMAGLRSSCNKDRYSIFRAHDGIRVGMVRGGDYGAVEGWGWLKPEDNPRPFEDERTIKTLRERDSSPPTRIMARRPPVRL